MTRLHVTKPKQNRLIEIIASLLLLFFVHSAISISYTNGFISLKNCLAFYTANTTLFAVLIILLEVTIAVLLFFPKTRTAGFIAVLLASLFAATALVYYPHFPHDFGGIINQLSLTQKWILLAFLSLLSITGLMKNLLTKKRIEEPEQGQILFT